MKKTIRLSIRIIALILLGYFIAGIYFYKQSIGFNTRPAGIDTNYTRRPHIRDSAWFDQQKTTNFELQSHYGYKLQGTIIEGKPDSKSTIILCHGIGADRWSMLKYAALYAERGYNMVLYDHPKHGKSGGELVSYGFFEKYDFQQVVEYSCKQFPNTHIGIHGESMGAATLIQHMPLNEKTKQVSFYVADCPYSDVSEEFRFRMKVEYNLSNLGLIEASSLINRYLNGFWFGDVSPVTALKKSSSPLLLLHGSADAYVPHSMSEDIFGARPENTTLVLIPEADHGQAISAAPQLYKKSVFEFIDSAGNKTAEDR